MPIPPLNPRTGYLPPGDHEASLEDLADRFGWNFRRRKLLSALEWVVRRLREQGVQEIYVDGSLTTSKERPRDVDVIYVAPATNDPDGWGLLSPARRMELKKLQSVDLWRHPSLQAVEGDPFKTQTLRQFFETDRDGVKKGLIRLVEGVKNDP